jgi:hypothetical protein
MKTDRSALFGVVSHRFWPTTLESCPPGLFLFDGGCGFKTEYSDQNGPEAYCVESGEYFWGGTNDAHARRMLMVTPVIITLNESGQARRGGLRLSKTRKTRNNRRARRCLHRLVRNRR